MTLAAPTIRLTPADVARLSDQDDKLYELVDGALVEKRVSYISNIIAARIAFILNAAYSFEQAFVAVEQPTYCFGDKNNEGRRPDVSLVWASRLPGGPTHSELFIAPDL